MDISIIAIIIAVVPTIISIILLFEISKLKSRYDKLTTGLRGKSLEDIVRRYVKILEQCEGDIKMMNLEFGKIRKETEHFFSKVGIVRFQGFKDTGGDQSFVLAVLDQNNNGFLLSSLYGRGFAKIYAKEIENGKSPKYKLTEEEQTALEQALEE